ncbi:SHOCT domain-containing protein [Pseudarthrobacter raffinosi]|uniref:SHOCT domain-containing protein n=1 Tax=Pseudarthrobacter raffinosi TaxID=2953651 RepID=UPI0027E2DBE6|nr:SHOCT domain-containing protein [Pseudarthrobacter sp. MDT3-26]
MMLGGFGSGMGSAWLFWLLLLIGIVLLGTLAVRFFFGGRNRGGTGRGEAPDRSGPGGTARRILDERYARGELSTEEYAERLRALADGT